MSEYAQKIFLFHCFRCNAYELKISPRYRDQKRRLEHHRTIAQS